METAFPSPLIQITRQEQQLRDWFMKQKLPVIPVKSLIVISNPQTVICTSPESYEIRNRVIPRDMLSTTVLQLDQSNPTPILSEKELKKASRLLKKAHVEADYVALERYSIEREELIKGVFCKSCQALPMLRKHGKWLCLECGKTSKTAHIQALEDYALLISTSITNHQLREFLQLQSSAIANRLLHSMNVPFTGTNKNRTYTLTSLLQNSVIQ